MYNIKDGRKSNKGKEINKGGKKQEYLILMKNMNITGER